MDQKKHKQQLTPGLNNPSQGVKNCSVNSDEFDCLSRPNGVTPKNSKKNPPLRGNYIDEFINLN